MADEEINLDELDEDINRKNRIEDRIRSLNDKVKLTAEERDEKNRLLEEQVSLNETLQSENKFLSSFTDITTQYPEASEFREAIKEKVTAGYDPMDAAVAVLAKEGKLNQPQAPVETPAPQAPESPVGGSSDNPPPTGGPKSVGEMSIDEKRAALLKEEQAGNISV